MSRDFLLIKRMEKKISLSQAQSIVDQWIKEKGVRYFNELTNMVLLMEEVGELARLIAREYGEQSYKNKDDASSIADELADIFFVIICLANQTGINLTDAFLKNLNKKNERDVKRHLNNPKLHKNFNDEIR